MEARNMTAILLASGFSKRMGEDKLLLPFRGGTLLSHAVDLVASIPFGQRLLVIPPERRKRLRIPQNITVILNTEAQRGQSESVKLGVRAATGQAYCFFAADQPLLDRETVECLLACSNDTRIVYPTGGGNPSGPVIFPAAFREALLCLEGDQGGRGIRRAHPEAQFPVVISNPHLLHDIDTRAEYKELLENNRPLQK